MEAAMLDNLPATPEPSFWGSSFVKSAALAFVWSLESRKEWVASLAALCRLRFLRGCFALERRTENRVKGRGTERRILERSQRFWEALGVSRPRGSLRSRPSEYVVGWRLYYYLENCSKTFSFGSSRVPSSKVFVEWTSFPVSPILGFIQILSIPARQASERYGNFFDWTHAWLNTILKTYKTSTPRQKRRVKAKVQQLD